MSNLLAPMPEIPPRMNLFPCDSKAAAVGILKTSSTLDMNTKMLLSTGLVSGILLAEAKRLGRVEWLAEQLLPTDIPLVRRLTKGHGPGQLREIAHRDVELRLKRELNEFCVHMGVNCRAGLHRGCGEVPLIRQGYPRDVIDPITADFFIAAYLALRVKDAQKPGRSAIDQLQFGIGLYFGAFDTLSAAQAAISPADKGKSVLSYPPVKDYLQCSCNAKDRDVAAYIQEVFSRR